MGLRVEWSVRLEKEPFQEPIFKMKNMGSEIEGKMIFIGREGLYKL